MQETQMECNTRINPPMTTALPSSLQREQVAADTRKIFQTGFYQALRLKPDATTDPSALVRAGLGRACEGYEWASRMAESESFGNPAVQEAVRMLLDRADAELSAAQQTLAGLPSAQP